MTLRPDLRTGTCAFRLMPDDAMNTAESSVAITRIGPVVVSLAYEWIHPEDGPQQGVLLVGGGPEGQGPDEADASAEQVDITVAWADSWHQQPGLRALHGTRTGGHVEVAATYAGDWGWTVELDGLDSLAAADAASDAPITTVMRNVVPESARDMLTEGAQSGAYDVMVARWGSE